MRILIRADASASIGTGHVMRCLTLADELVKYNAAVTFVCRQLPEYLKQLIQSHHHALLELPLWAIDNNSPPEGILSQHQQLKDVKETIEIASGICWDYLIVDHYRLDHVWEKEFRNYTKKIFVIDDLADRIHDCDLLLDQNYYINLNDRYADKVPEHCQLLLGPKYALLREEFRQAHLKAKPRTVVNQILVCFGGVDLENYTGRVIDALAQMNLKNIAIDVVIGAQHPARDTIESLSKRNDFSCHVQVNNMAELMLAADLAIGSGGSISWERCCVGLPSNIMSVARNQDAILSCMSFSGYVLGLPSIKAGNFIGAVQSVVQSFISAPDFLHGMSQRCLDLVDGCGAGRVVNYCLPINIQFRHAEEKDCQAIYDWRNHISVRQYAHDAVEIDYASHENWFLNVLTRKDRIVLVGELDGLAVGVVRFDLIAGEATISIYLKPEKQSQGLGSKMLMAAQYWLQRHDARISRIKAEVVAQNIASQSAFLKAGYKMHHMTFYRDLS